MNPEATLMRHDVFIVAVLDSRSCLIFKSLQNFKKNVQTFTTLKEIENIINSDNFL